MIKKVSVCVDCGLPCLGKSCPHNKVYELICDDCKETVEVLYDDDDRHYCEGCLLDSHLRIFQDNVEEYLMEEEDEKICY